jgi:hypothetical protein
MLPLEFYVKLHMYGIFGTIESSDVVMYLPQNKTATAQRYSNIFNVHLHIIPSSLCTNNIIGVLLQVSRTHAPDVLVSEHC